MTSSVISDCFLGTEEIKVYHLNKSFIILICLYFYNFQDYKMKNGKPLPLALSQLFREAVYFMLTHPHYLLKMVLFRYNAPFILPSRKEKEIIKRAKEIRAVVATFIKSLHLQYKKNGARSEQYLVDYAFVHMKDDDNAPATEEKFLTLDNMIDTYAALFFAGTDTTAGLTTSGVLMMAMYPEI